MTAIDSVKPFRVYLYGPPECESQQSTGPILTSFDQAVSRLEAIPGISLEPDGSFAFACRGGQERLFGVLYDAGGNLQYVDIQGQVSLAVWREITAAISGECLALAQLVVLQIPDRTLKSFQMFETETWPGHASLASDKNK